jgi:hypothetical protein
VHALLGADFDEQDSCAIDHTNLTSQTPLKFKYEAFAALESKQFG